MMRLARAVLLVAATAHVTGVGAGAGAGATWVGGVKQLFIDDYLVASTTGPLVRTMNRPAKLGRRVLQPDQPWEQALGVDYGLYGSVLREEIHGANTTRLWYFAVDGNASAERPYLQAYAASPGDSGDAGLVFSKPPLGQATLNGTPAAGMPNNVLAGLSGWNQREGASVWRDEREALGARYVSQSKISPTGDHPGMLQFAVSHDGLVWNDSGRFWWDPGVGGYASRAVQFHPHGGQSDFAWLSARTPHVGPQYVW